MGAIVWLASYPKSGNTWMRIFLHNLLMNPEKPIGINQIGAFSYGESSTNWYRGLTEGPLLDCSRAEVAKLRPRAQMAMTQASQDSIFVKTHNTLGSWHGVPVHNMDATVGAIYMLRNPLDVCLSMTAHYGQTIDQAIDRLADAQALTGHDEKHVPEVHGDWTNHVKSWTQDQHKQKLVIRYEDMLHKPLPTFSSVARYLQLKPPQSRLKKAIKFSSFRELKQQEQKEDFKERSKHAKAFFRKGKAGQWRDELSEDQVAHLIEDHYEQMKLYRYLPQDADERVAAWHKRIDAGDAEDRETFDARVLEEKKAKLEARKNAGDDRGAARQDLADEDGAIGALKTSDKQRGIF